MFPPFEGDRETQSCLRKCQAGTETLVPSPSLSGHLTRVTLRQPTHSCLTFLRKGLCVWSGGGARGEASALLETTFGLLCTHSTLNRRDQKRKEVYS